MSEKGWLNEADIVCEARRRLLSLPHGSLLVKHLPDLIAFRDVNGSDTDIILGSHSGHLNIPSPPPKYATPHILRLPVLFPKLIPVFEISEELILKAWLDCFKCHFSLWNQGIEHGDISPWNLMWDENNQCGILNDWDHACVREGIIMKNGKKETGVIDERTGSISFMARELLPGKYASREPLRRQHRHEVESFIWTLSFICMHRWIMADTSSESQPGSMREKLSNEIKIWRTGSPSAVRVAKDSFLLRVLHTISDDEHPTCNVTWKKTLMLLELLLYLEATFEEGNEPNSEYLHEAVVAIARGELTRRKDLRSLALTPEYLRPLPGGLQKRKRIRDSEPSHDSGMSPKRHASDGTS